METKQIIMYVIVNSRNKPDLYTLRQTKGECIATFETNMESSWKNARKYGWRCIKLDVTISSVSNEPSWL